MRTFVLAIATLVLLPAAVVVLPDNGTASNGAGATSQPLSASMTALQGTDWTNLTPASAPAGRVFPAVAYDSESDRIILFGGATGITGVDSDETWAYDLHSNTWTAMVSSDTWPSGLSKHAMAYDAQSDRVILFGAGYAYTYAYDFNTDEWTAMNPATKPGGRWGHAMVYDAESDLTILFGGTGDPFSNETWAYDYETDAWTMMAPSLSWPSGRTEHAMAYDSESDRLILFGGWANAANDETWAYDLNTNRWASMDPPVGPSARSGHAMAYDAQADRVVLFGGAAEVSNDETWAYDYNTNTWTQMNSLAPPSARYGHAKAYDLESKRTVLFGGFTGSRSAETWAYEYLPTPPSVPQYLRATPGDAQATLSWQAPLSDGASPVTNYTVYRGVAPGTPSFLIELGNVLSYIDTGLTNNVTYTYEVSAENAIGEGERSAEDTARPSEDTIGPTILITSPRPGAKLSSQTVAVVGTASDVHGVQKVELSTDGTTWVLATGTTSWSGTLTLEAGQHTIYVRATDGWGNDATTSLPVEVTFAVPILPIAGAVAAVVAVTAASIFLARSRRRGGGKGQA